MLRRTIIGLLLSFSPTLVWAQGALLSGGSPVPGQAPMYSGPQGGSQAVVQPSGPAGGGGNGLGLSELLQVNRAAGTGPYGSHVALYDNPLTHAGGYHYLSMDANASGGGLLAYGYGGGASPLPFQFCVNGTCYQFPFVIGGIVGPPTTAIGDVAYWNNTAGTLLADSAALKFPLGPIALPGDGFTYTNRTTTIINRLSDRLFVGQDTATNNGSTSPADWLSSLTGLTFLGTFSQLYVLSSTGTEAITGASRSSVAGASSVGIGVSGVGINDFIGDASQWGGYFEGRRSSGNTGTTRGVEVDSTNFGSVVDLTPYSAPAGMTLGLSLAAGGSVGTAASTAAIGVGPNGQRWRKGFVFGEVALDNTVGGGGNGVALEFALRQSQRWLKSDGTPVSEIYGDDTPNGGLQVLGNLTTHDALVGLGTATFSGALTAAGVTSTANLGAVNMALTGSATIGTTLVMGGALTAANGTFVGSVAAGNASIAGALSAAGGVSFGATVDMGALPTSSGGKCVGITGGGALYISGVTC